MKRLPYLTIYLLGGLVLLMFIPMPYVPEPKTHSTMTTVVEIDIKLPPPRLTGETSIEEALFKRRSVRAYKKEMLSLTSVAQLLWASQGITDKGGMRTAPSAGALYPLEVYLVSGAVDGLPAGVYHYHPSGHRLERVTTGDKRAQLAAVAGMQNAVSHGAAVLVIAADNNRTRVKYGQRAARYVHMEAGHVAQNVYLQSVALNVKTVAIGAFNDGLVKQVLSLPKNEEPLYLMPLGK